MANSEDVIKDHSLQPRISYELTLGGAVTGDTMVQGYDGSLDTLFSIATTTTTWAEIVKVCCSDGKPKPVWMLDLEAASRSIADEKNPNVSATKCVLKGSIYRVFTSRYEIYKSKKRVVYAGFLPAVNKTFDLKRTSATLLSSLILSVRFREQLIPMSGLMAQAEDPSLALMDFYRSLLAIEIEAQQFGLTVDGASADDAPLLSAVRDEGARGIIEAGVSDWLQSRKQIDEMFSVNASGRDRHADAAAISSILRGIEPVNGQFIEAITEELLAQVRRERIAKDAKPHQAERHDLAVEARERG